MMKHETLSKKIDKIKSVYNAFDKGHDERHFENVCDNAIEICKSINYDNTDLIYACVAYHDIGLIGGRKNHEMLSGMIIENDNELKEIFNEEEIKLIKTAVEEHRTGKVKTTLESKILSDADKLDGVFNLGRMFKRSICTNISIFDSPDDLYNKTINHLRKKYGKNGTMKLELHIPENEQAKKNIEYFLTNDIECRQLFDNIMTFNYIK